MRIVICIDLFDYENNANGTVMTAYRFVDELRKRGHTVIVVATGAKGEDCYEVEERYIPLVTEISRTQQIRFAKPDYETLVNAFTGADIIHLYLPFKFEKKARKIAKMMHIPCTAAFHLQPENITYNCGIKHSRLIPSIIYSWFKNTFYKHFEHIHCPSQFTAAQCRKHGFKAKLHIISNGVDKDFKPLNEYREPGEMFNIIMVGRFGVEKRQDVLIKAVAQSKYRDKIHLILAGNGSKEKYLRKLSNKYLGGAVEFAFYNKEQLIDTLHKCDLYVHTGEVENEAIACIEAISCGLVPVIANSKNSATPQFALDERSLFKAGNAKDLAQKIDYWIENPEDKRRAAEDYIASSEKYRISYSIIKTEEMFKEAIADAKKDKKFKTQEAKEVRRKIVLKSGALTFFSMLMYYIIAIPILYVYCKIAYGLKIKGRKNLYKLKSHGAVTVSNHVHLLDAAMNALALYPRYTMFVAKEDNFDLPIAGRLLRMLGAIAVPKDYKYTDLFFSETSKLLRKKRLVHIYPEGHLVNYYGGFREFQRGAFKMACEAQVPILPIAISWRKRRGLNKLIMPKRPAATVTIGEPITPDYLLLKREMELDLKARTEAKLNELYAQSNKGESINIFEGKSYSEYLTGVVYEDDDKPQESMGDACANAGKDEIKGAENSTPKDVE